MDKKWTRTNNKLRHLKIAEIEIAWQELLRNHPSTYLPTIMHSYVAIHTMIFIAMFVSLCIHCVVLPGLKCG